MNKRVRIGLVLLITLILLLGLTIPGMAKKSPDYVLTYVFDEVDWDNYSATGTFELTNANLFKEGDVTMNWTPKPGVKKGRMDFIDLGWDTFAVEFALATVHANRCGTGSYQILMQEGTGVYEDVGGSGTITMCRENNDTITGTLEGLTSK